MNNKVSVVLVISKTLKFEKRSQYKAQSFRPYENRRKMWGSLFTK